MFNPLIQKRFLVIVGKVSLLALTVPFLLLFSPVALAAEAPKKVLIFSGTDSGLPSVVLVNQILRSTLERDLPVRVQFYNEALDNHRIPETKYEQEMVTLLQRKYEAEKIDLIFTLGSQALKFC